MQILATIFAWALTAIQCSSSLALVMPLGAVLLAPEVLESAGRIAASQFDVIL
jgi:hypothetical protein